ncbi:putative inorganic phosphate cotransporter [Copidosoma floridanum]|uniref:putative inorganic phosphate cotransporter n=1 Tax=Copidosoma floridanum TaxID=29053 RepID=UPI0006C9BF29|nr:putative inorganic phosphate cotransporter [Copidosoma floridanum]
MAALRNCSFIPQRWVVVLMAFFGLFNAYSMRICLSIAITQMVQPSIGSVEYVDDTCPDYHNNDNTTINNNNDTDIDGQLYDWSEYTQGIILSSFYWGYLLTNLPGGVIAERFGGKHTLGLGILSTAVLTILTPSCVIWGGSTALVYLRVLMGFCEGATYPAISVLLSQWVPQNERSKAGSVAFSGAPLGTIFGMTASGLILQYSAGTGWPMVFYFFGGVGIVNFFLNSMLCYNKPTEHPFISEAETKLLKKQLKHTHESVPPTPWRHILTSLPVWALMVATIGNSWGFLTICSDMPKYMSSVLKFSVRENGYFSSLPYLCMWLTSCLASWLSDRLISGGAASISAVRKIGCTIASLGPGVFVVAVSYAGCDGFLAVAMLTIGMALMGCAISSILINALDLGPNYAGTIMGLANGISTLSGIVSPYVVGVITPNQTISEWRAVFWIVFAFFVVSNAFYLVYGSGELQEWNDPKFLKKERRLADSADVKKESELLAVESQFTDHVEP